MVAFVPISALFDLGGKRALVTGAGRGIGQAVALRLADAGATVIAHDLTEAHCAETADRVRAGGGRIEFACGDLMESEGISAIVGRAAGNQGIDSLILPAVTLSIVPLVNIARVTRSSVLSVLPQDYVRTARAKGLRNHAVILRHIVRNGLIPVVTVGGIVLGQALSGAVITEQIFAWPGIG